MLKKTIISAAFGAAVMIAASTGSNAMPGGLGLGSLQTETGQSNVIQVGKKFNKKFKHFHWNHHYYPRFRGCYWLKKKAIFTGKKYWWHRYHECKYYYYY